MSKATFDVLMGNVVLASCLLVGCIAVCGMIASGADVIGGLIEQWKRRKR